MILFLDKMPHIAALGYEDRIVGAGISSAHSALTMPDMLDLPSRTLHLWTWANISNYSWMMIHAKTLVGKYEEIHGVKHEFHDRIMEAYNQPRNYDIPQGEEFTEVPLLMPEIYRTVEYENPPPTTHEDALHHRNVEMWVPDYASLSDAVEYYKIYHAALIETALAEYTEMEMKQ